MQLTSKPAQSTGGADAGAAKRSLSVTARIRELHFHLLSRRFLKKRLLPGVAASIAVTSLIVTAHTVPSSCDSFYQAFLYDFFLDKFASAHRIEELPASQSKTA